MIEQGDDKHFYISGMPYRRFETISGIIDYYSKHPIGKKGATLSEPVPVSAFTAPPEPDVKTSPASRAPRLSDDAPLPRGFPPQRSIISTVSANSKRSESPARSPATPEPVPEATYVDLISEPVNKHVMNVIDELRERRASSGSKSPSLGGRDSPEVPARNGLMG